MRAATNLADGSTEDKSYLYWLFDSPVKVLQNLKEFHGLVIVLVPHLLKLAMIIT